MCGSSFICIFLSNLKNNYKLIRPTIHKFKHECPLVRALPGKIIDRSMTRICMPLPSVPCEQHTKRIASLRILCYIFAGFHTTQARCAAQPWLERIVQFPVKQFLADFFVSFRMLSWLCKANPTATQMPSGGK